MWKLVMATVIVLGALSAEAVAKGELRGVRNIAYTVFLGEDAKKCGVREDTLTASAKLPINAYTKMRETGLGGVPYIVLKVHTIRTEALCAHYIEIRVVQFVKVKLPQDVEAMHEISLWQQSAMSTGNANADRSQAAVNGMMEQMARMLATDWQVDNP